MSAIYLLIYKMILGVWKENSIYLFFIYVAIYFRVTGKIWKKKNTKFNLKLGLNLLILWLKLKKLTIYKISFSSKLLKVLLTLNRYTSSVGKLIILQRLATVISERIKEIKYRNKNIRNSSKTQNSTYLQFLKKKIIKIAKKIYGNFVSISSYKNQHTESKSHLLRSAAERWAIADSVYAAPVWQAFPLAKKLKAWKWSQ